MALLKDLELQMGKALKIDQAFEWMRGSTMDKEINKQVSNAIEHYPDNAKSAFYQLRQMIVDIVSESDVSDVGSSNDGCGTNINGLESIEETLKWNEPSYLAEKGSTVRFAWKDSKPSQIGVYFICRTNLVETFKELYGSELHFEKNRAIILNLHEALPVDSLKHCIGIALDYKQLKHKPLLGA